MQDNTLYDQSYIDFDRYNCQLHILCFRICLTPIMTHFSLLNTCIQANEHQSLPSRKPYNVSLPTYSVGTISKP